MKPLTRKDAGCVLRCAYSIVDTFKIGKCYTTKPSKDYDRCEIGEDDFVINSRSPRYHKVNGIDETIATFTMVKDSKGRYIKNAYRCLMLTKLHDKRRARRAIRQTYNLGGEKALLKFARNFKR